MCQTIDEMLMDERAEGEAIGLERGRSEGALQTMIELVKDNLLKIEVAASRVNMTTDEFRACM